MKPKYEELATTKPDLNEIAEDFRWCTERRDSTILGRARLNSDSRYCRWAGQSEDGRKWHPQKGKKEIWPWPGAADSRPHLIDLYIKQHASQLMLIWRRNKIQVQPTESGDIELATRLTQLLRWLRYTQMTECRREARLAANWFLERGAVVGGMFWDRQKQLGYDEIDHEQVMVRAMEAATFAAADQRPPGWSQEQVADAITFATTLNDPSKEDQVVTLFQKYYSDVKPAAARQAVKDLRETGAARFVRPYIKKDRPCLVTLLPNDEIFIPEDACDLDESCRSLYRVELLTETALRERITTKGWNAAWVEEVVAKQRGNVTFGVAAAGARMVNRTGGLGTLHTQKLFSIVHAYRRLSDENSVPGIYYTCFHPDMIGRKAARKGLDYAYHTLLNYDHGEYPFTLATREVRSRRIDDSRGYGEMGNTWQNLIKGFWDSAIDAESITTNPPSYHPPDEEPESWGPGIRVPTRRPENFGFFKGPDRNSGNREMEGRIRDHADEYFGQPLADGRNAIFSQAMQQDMADTWMEFWGGLDTQALQLQQQFASKDLYFRVVGSDKAQPLHATREEIQGKFDVSISYNIGYLDTEKVKIYLDFINQLLGWDIGGRVDRDELLVIGFEMFEPNLAERVLKPAQQAAGQEIDDERQVLNSLLNGIPVDVKPGQAWQMRAQWLQQTIMQSKKAQQLYTQDEAVKEAIDRRLQELNHQVEQHTVNAQAGRLGGMPDSVGSGAGEGGQVGR